MNHNRTRKRLLRQVRTALSKQAREEVCPYGRPTFTCFEFDDCASCIEAGQKAKEHLFVPAVAEMTDHDKLAAQYGPGYAAVLGERV